LLFNRSDHLNEQVIYTLDNLSGPIGSNEITDTLFYGKQIKHGL